MINDVNRYTREIEDIKATYEGYPEQAIYDATNFKRNQDVKKFLEVYRAINNTLDFAYELNGGDQKEEIVGSLSDLEETILDWFHNKIDELVEVED